VYIQHILVTLVSITVSKLKQLMSVCGLCTVLYVVVTTVSRNFGLVFERVAVWQRCCNVRNMSDLIKLAWTVFVRDKEVNKLNSEEGKRRQRHGRYSKL